ncbi:MAG: response regulator [Rhodocyclaceae bacterium]|jgi:adenylate cyclase|nr:response regulator [Rhodocyclaceae bacterium]MBK6908681.1 response regulator [Rhodocyclaceae bacterium]
MASARSAPTHTTDASERRPTLLVVDDAPQNLSLMSDILEQDYNVKLAASGTRALAIVAAQIPDLILLDIVMPEMDGYEVCARLKASVATYDIPIIFVTSLDGADDETRGLALGAVDYLTKPINPDILKARVYTHLALRRQAVMLSKQTRALRELNETLEARVAEESARVKRLERLRRFFSPAVADVLLSTDPDAFLAPRRREIVVVFLDLRGYTAFTENFPADEVMRVLSEFHAAMGELITNHGGTVERFTGDGMMIFFNDPIEIDDPAGTALRMAVQMQERFQSLATLWSQRGCVLSMGIGIAKGIATIGAIGFDGRRDYGAIGSVTNLAARLCAEAEGGATLVSAAVAASVANHLGMPALRARQALTLKGFREHVAVFDVLPA